MAIYVGLIVVIVVTLVALIITRVTRASVSGERNGTGLSANSKRLIIATIALVCAVGALVLSFTNPPS